MMAAIGNTTRLLLARVVQVNQTALSDEIWVEIAE
jgi:hypothetical protein